MLKEVYISPQSLDRYAPFVPPERIALARAGARRVAALLEGRAIFNINSTAAGGGVAELLHALLGYARGEGLDARWLVISGPPEFFVLTRRLHDALHAAGPFECPGAERALYEQTLADNAAELDAVIEPGDVVILHDPQTAGLAPHLVRRGAHVIWRCHIGHDVLEGAAAAGWRFLGPYLEPVQKLVFTRPSYVPPQFAGRATIIPPTIDPTAVKNQELPAEVVRGILVHTGVLQETVGASRRSFTRQDGSPGRVERFVDVMRLGSPPPWDRPTVVQISRWDHLKDPIGVMRGFARCMEAGNAPQADLILAGPNVHGVADDPAASRAYADALEVWRALPHPVRHHVHLVTLPMADIEENAAIVNALQRHAAVVVQKSLHEGFGLTVAEAMWKARPVIASAVGGIRDQIDPGQDGLLIDDPGDIAAFAGALERLLGDPEWARQLGMRAREKVRGRFLGLETLIAYAELIAAQG